MAGIALFAPGLVGLLCFRFVMGLACGPVYPMLLSTVRKTSPGGDFPRNAGIVENGEALISTMAGPVAIVALMGAFGWQMTYLFLIPPLIAIATAWLLLRRRVAAMQVRAAEANFEVARQKPAARELLGNRNLMLCVALGILSFTAIWTMYVYGPIYWRAEGGLSAAAMSYVMTAMGVVAAVWCLVLPLVSNKVGRKPVVVCFALLCAANYLVLYLKPGSPLSMVLFILFAGSACTLSMFFVALISAESVRPAISASAISLVSGGSELFGAAVGSLIAGLIADAGGVPVSMLFAAGCMVLAAGVSLFLRETAFPGGKKGGKV